MVRNILYTGKGGVGKTSIAAATALGLADRGNRTVVMSTDSAHSLSDAFGIELGSSPKVISDNLSALEINVHTEIAKNWGEISGFIVNFLKSQGFSGIIAEEFAVLPGMEELFCLLKLNEFNDTGAYDVAIIDCAPTGSTLRMLGLPDAFQWYFNKVFALEKRLVKAIKPVAERVLNIPFPSDEVYDSLKALFDKIIGMRNILQDPRLSSIRLVLNPERMVILESRRALSCLNLFGYPVDAAIMNRVLPAEAKNSYFAQWQKIHLKHLKEAAEVFDGLTLWTARWRDKEIAGIDALRELAADIFGDEDPAQVASHLPSMKIETCQDGYVLSLHLPGISRDELDLWVKDSELIIQVKNFQRHYILPHKLHNSQISKAHMEGDVFKVVFS